jgi:hypothetical protein
VTLLGLVCKQKRSCLKYSCIHLSGVGDHVSVPVSQGRALATSRPSNSQAPEASMDLTAGTDEAPCASAGFLWLGSKDAYGLSLTSPSHESPNALLQGRGE